MSSSIAAVQPISKRLPRALIVEPDHAEAASLRSALRGCFDADCASSGSEAIRKAIEAPPDLMLLDLRLPNIDGYEVVRQLREHPASSRLPVVCMTDQAQDPESPLLRRQGVIGVLRKPLELGSLARDVRQIYEGANSRLRSRDGKRAFTLAFSPDEKDRLIRKEVHALVEEGRPCALVSLRDGGELCRDGLEPYLEDSRLTYLRARPLLISKLPYLRDYSEVVEDILSLLGPSGPDPLPHLLLDDPLLLFKMQDPRITIAGLHALASELVHRFAGVQCFSVRPTEPAERNALNEIAYRLCQ